jgi:isoleucyl-tRNA synthetase
MRDEALGRRWQTILALRSEVTRALEEARQAKVIGHPLDAAVKLALPSDLQGVALDDLDLLRSVFIVSQVALAPASDLTNPVSGVEMPELKIQVAPSSEPKCERCWVRSESVGQFDDHPTLCDRCNDVMTSEAR